MCHSGYVYCTYIYIYGDPISVNSHFQQIKYRHKNWITAVSFITTKNVILKCTYQKFEMGENWLFVGEIWLGGTSFRKWGKMGDHPFLFCVSPHSSRIVTSVANVKTELLALLVGLDKHHTRATSTRMSWNAREIRVSFSPVLNRAVWIWYSFKANFVLALFNGSFWYIVRNFNIAHFESSSFRYLWKIVCI